MLQNMLKIICNISFFLLFIAQTACNDFPGTTVRNTRCEYLENPIGIDISQPRFTWELASEKQGVLQTAYRISIAFSADLLEKDSADVWQSDKISGSEQWGVLAGPQKLESFTKYYWNVKVWLDSDKNPVVSETATFETAMMSEKDWSAAWISDTHDEAHEPSPLFRKEIRIETGKKINSARLYISGLGYYEAFINGNRIGENYLDPAYTAFDKRVYYVTHDVTSLLQSGQNVLATVLGNGWYNEQSTAVWDFHKARWRNRPRMICELHIHYADGSAEKIVSNETWKTNTGAYMYNNLYSGDMYDARKGEKGWELSGFNDSHWHNANIISDFQPVLQAQLFPAIQISKEIQPVSMHKRSDSLYVFDFGENFSGFTSIKTTGEASTTIWLKHGELLDNTGRLEQGNIDVYYHPVQEKEKFQTNVFMLQGNGQTETFQPSFTYHGFQYLEVESNKPIHLSPENVKGYFVHTNLEQTGQFSCSDETLNKLWRATNQSYLSNMHSIPTDCPQREKNGWTADAHVAAEAGLLNFDGITIYEKWMRDLIDNQRENGSISGIIPSAGWGYTDWIGPVWDAALFIIPDELYNYYGDKRIIEQLHPYMEKYLDYLKTRESGDYMLAYGLGDWLTFEAQTPQEYTSTAFYYLDYTLMSKFAALLGKDATAYQEKAKKIKEKINEVFYDSNTYTYANGTQTAQALALYLNIVPDGNEQKVADVLAETIRKNNGFLNFGLLGTKTVPRMLTKYGYGDMALQMIIRPESPSWGNWVDSLHYTTLPETWRLSPEFRDASLNHVFFGDVSAWMYRYLGGINYDESKPAFQHIIIEPYFIDGINWVKAEYNSVKGTIRSEWKREGQKITLQIEIPAGSTASVILNGKTDEIGSGIHQYKV